MLAASEFEFKQRFWIIGLLFSLAFWCYLLDPKNAGATLIQWIARLRHTATTRTDYHLIFAFAAILCVLAAWIRTWGTAYLRSEVMIAGRVQTSHLVADGPYRHVRNPLYLGIILLTVGMGLMASRTGFPVLISGMMVFCYRLILREEAGIAAHQGERYRAYCEAVPRLWPTLRPRLTSAGGTANWADGLLGEAFMWVMAASVVAYAITLNLTIYLLVLGSSFLVYAICLAVIRRRH